MRLSTAAARAFCANPTAGVKAALIYGPDAGEVATLRRALIRSLGGPEAEAELRLVALDAAAMRSDPAALEYALRGRGFFPGRRVVWVGEATEALVAPIEIALDSASEHEAWLVVTAGALTGKGRLRRIFESAQDTVALACYGDPPNRAELEAMLRGRGCAVTADGALAVEDAIRILDSGAVAQFVELLALYKLGDAEPLSAVDVAACAPARTADGADEAATAVAERQPGAVLTAITRLASQGVDPIQIVNAALRRFILLHAIAASGDEPMSALARMRPPSFGKRRDELAQQSRHWKLPAIEAALLALHELDAKLRSSANAPHRALTERTLLRIALSLES